MPTQHNYLPIDRCRVSVFVSVHIEKVTISGVLIWSLRMFPSWSFANISFFQPHAFLMIGIPGLEAIHGWISILFFSMYTAALTGNCLRRDSSVVAAWQDQFSPHQSHSAGSGKPSSAVPKRDCGLSGPGCLF